MDTHIAQKMKKDARRSSVAGQGSSNRRGSIAESIGMQINETEQKSKSILNILTRRTSSVAAPTPTPMPTPTGADAPASPRRHGAAPDGADRGPAALPDAHPRHGAPTSRFVSGDAFGESALSRPSSRRERTVVARCRTQLLVIRRYTYDRLIQRTNNEAWSEHLSFLSTCPALAGMRRSASL